VRWYGEGKLGHVSGVMTAPVGVQDASSAAPAGAVHLAGNVWEWTSQDQGALWKVARGGSYMNLPSYCRCDHLEPMRPDEPRLTVGFRCISSSP
jgi:formylglycine-generating enzyme required for sulfatase activity